MSLKRKTFSGGYKFQYFAGRPQKKLVEATLPEKVTILLKQGCGHKVTAIVNVGDSVKAGQIIGRNDDILSCPVHATVNGMVEEIKKIDSYNGAREVKAVTIESDGTAEWLPLEGHNPKWNDLPLAKIEELVYSSGAAGLDKGGIPTRYKSSIIAPADVEDIIIHETYSDVFNPSLSVLLDKKNLPGFIEGLKILKKMIPTANLHLAFNKCKERLIDNISKQMSDCNWIQFYNLESKYPLNFEEVIVPIVLNKKYPYGYSAANIGCVVLSPQTILHVYEAVTQGKAVIERIIALGGPGFDETPHIKIRVGSSLGHIIKNKSRLDKELRFISDSPISGTAFPGKSSPVDRTTKTIISLLEGKGLQFFPFMMPYFQGDTYSRTNFSFLSGRKKSNTNLHGEKRPCLFCGFCEDVCPVGIIPHLISKYVDRDMVDENLLNLKIFNCIGCNLCTYVCPSKIPVACSIRSEERRVGKECRSRLSTYH